MRLRFFSEVRRLKLSSRSPCRSSRSPSERDLFSVCSLKHQNFFLFGFSSRNFTVWLDKPSLWKVLLPCHMKFFTDRKLLSVFPPEAEKPQGLSSLFFTAPIGLPSPNAARGDLPSGTLSFRLYFQTARNFALHVAALSNAFLYKLFRDLPARFFRLV